MSNIQPVLDAIKRFIRDCNKDNMKAVAWPTCDPNFSIQTIELEGDYIRLFGVDEKNLEAMLIIPISQFGIQMRCESADAQRKSIGFVSSDRFQS